MFTPFNILQLDQGKEFARQELKRLYAEPQAPTVDAPLLEPKSETAATRRPIFRAVLAELLGLFGRTHPISVR